MIARASIPVRLAGVMMVFAAAWARGEDGSKLWLRYAGEQAHGHPRRILLEGKSATCNLIRSELAEANLTGDEAIVVGTPANSELIRSLGWDAELNELGREGFIIRSAEIEQKPAMVVASSGEAGSLYGTFHLLRLAQTNQLNPPLAVSQK